MPVAFGGNNQSGQIDVATACNACASASGRMDFETETFLVQPTHTLRGEGFDAGEDGTGRGTPLVPHVVGALACNTGPNGHDAGNFACNQAVDAGHVLPVVPVAYATKLHNTASNGAGKFYENYTASLDANSPPPAIVFDTTQITSAANYSNPKPGDPCHPLAAGAHAPAIAFHSNAQADQLPTTARDNGAQFIHCNKGRPAGRLSEHTETVAIKPLVETLTTDGHQQSAVFTPAMQVRRLTPTEAERLQGFPDNYTAIPWRGKPADQCPDGPRYKALGNSWAVPVVRWIGERIAGSLN